MNSGDRLQVTEHDTADGLQVVINDVTTGVSPIVPTAKAEKIECVVEGNDVKVKLNGA